LSDRVHVHQEIASIHGSVTDPSPTLYHLLGLDQGLLG
jgi:hypothetical protein